MAEYEFKSVLKDFMQERFQDKFLDELSRRYGRTPEALSLAIREEVALMIDDIGNGVYEFLKGVQYTSTENEGPNEEWECEWWDYNESREVLRELNDFSIKVSIVHKIREEWVRRKKNG